MHVSENFSSAELPRFPIDVSCHIKNVLRLCVGSGPWRSRYQDGIRCAKDIFWKVLVKDKGGRSRMRLGEPLGLSV